MSKEKEFKYESQDYQNECIENINAIFQRLQDGESFEKVLQENMQIHKYPCNLSKNKNIDILMETGTGKTFTYMKMMLELCKKFSYKKFILLVPSVAIREGVSESFKDLENYFKACYSNTTYKRIEPLVYESGKKNAVESFIRDDDQLSCLIMTPKAFDHKDKILNRPLERHIEYYINLVNNKNAKLKDGHMPKNLLDILKVIEPIVIIDEPHRFDGEAFKKYFEGFNNYYFRFGATFPAADKQNKSNSLSNIAYMLTSAEAFNKMLVKQITVFTQDIINAPQAISKIITDRKEKIVRVNNFSNGDFAGQINLSVGDNFCGKMIKKINVDNIILADGSKVEMIADFILSDEAMALMIKDAVKIHFEKEAELFNKSIKALTLFFIGNISQYRNDGIVKKIFEKEYRKARKEKIEQLSGNPEFSAYLDYLKKDFNNDGILQVNKGYFSGDKGGKDERIKQGVDEILRDKKKLLSFESPTRFVFSVWALQEGWDNPNVFTICKLSNASSEISKLQQVGRGLRICVNQDLQRQTIREFDGNADEFHSINNLDIITSSQEADFVEGIQNEIFKNSYLLNDYFTENDLVSKLKYKNNFTDNHSREIVNFLHNDKLIVATDDFDESNHRIFKRCDDYETQVQTLKENPDSLPKNLTLADLLGLDKIFAGDNDKNSIRKNKDRENDGKKCLRIKDKHLQAFQDLWETINQRSIYFIEELDERQQKEMVANIADTINKLDMKPIYLQLKKTLIKEENESKEPEPIFEQSTRAYTKIDYISFAKNLAMQAKIPLSLSVDILNSMSGEFKTEALTNNPKQLTADMVEIIKQYLFTTIKTRITYEAVDGSIYGDGVMYEKNNKFKKRLDAGSLGRIQVALPENFPLKDEWIFEDVYEYDSEFEKNIIIGDPKQDTKQSRVKIFAKMPRLKIDTPIGTYSPDFCYSIESENGLKIILIVEAKGYQTEPKIRQEEKNKIDFAKKYFERLNTTFKDKKIIYKARINKMELSNLISEALGK